MQLQFTNAHNKYTVSNYPGSLEICGSANISAHVYLYIGIAAVSSWKALEAVQLPTCIP